MSKVNKSSPIIRVHTDGGARGNPGLAAIGVVIEAPISKNYSKFLGNATNNEAEYEAVIFALTKLKAILGSDKIKNVEVQIFMDSELAVRQLSGKYKVESPNIIPKFIKVHNLSLDFGNLVFHHVLRENNKDADKLVNVELDKHTHIDTLFNL